MQKRATESDKIIRGCGDMEKGWEDEERNINSMPKPQYQYYIVSSIIYRLSSNSFKELVSKGFLHKLFKYICCNAEQKPGTLKT